MAILVFYYLNKIFFLLNRFHFVSVPIRIKDIKELVNLHKMEVIIYLAVSKLVKMSVTYRNLANIYF